MRDLLRYHSGEDVRVGDHVLYEDIPAQVEMIASDPDDPEQKWYIQTCGAGVCLIEQKIFGRLFTTAIDSLELVRRGTLETSP